MCTIEQIASTSAAIKKDIGIILLPKMYCVSNASLIVICVKETKLRVTTHFIFWRKVALDSG